MKRRDVLLSGGVAALTFSFAGQAKARPRLISVGVTESGSLNRNRPDWPVPREPGQVMYMQRSLNPNTVVWTANFDGAGNLGSPPAQVYWRKFNDNGERKSLTALERTVGFGLNIRPNPEPDRFTISARALPQFPFLLVQSGPRQAQAWCRIGGRSVIADHVYMEMKGSVQVVGMYMHGRDPRSGTYLREQFRVEGGVLG